MSKSRNYCVGRIDGKLVHGHYRRRWFTTMAEAEVFIGMLKDAERGAYYLDDCTKERKK